MSVDFDGLGKMHALSLMELEIILSLSLSIVSSYFGDLGKLVVYLDLGRSASPRHLQNFILHF